MKLAAAPLSLSDTPLSLPVNVNPIVFFELDDSGCMDWEILTKKDWSYCEYDRNALIDPYSSAAEGIPINNGEHVLIADTPKAFTEATVRVIQDSTLAERLAKNCRNLIMERYGIPQLRREAEAILRYLDV